MSGQPPGWPRRRFSQAISEGDGISVIPLVRGPLEARAREAEDAGAEALAVELPDDVAALRQATGLPLVLHAGVPGEGTLRAARAAGADACVLAFGELAGEGTLLEELAGVAQSLGLDWALAAVAARPPARTPGPRGPGPAAPSARPARTGQAPGPVDLERPCRTPSPTARGARARRGLVEQAGTSGPGTGARAIASI